MIKYLHLKGLTPNQISTDMRDVLGDDTPSQATICRRVAEFQRVRQSTEDEQRSERPADTCSDDNVQSVQDMMQKDRRLNIRYVADSLKMSYGTTRHIITYVLGVRSMGATNAEA